MNKVAQKIMESFKGMIPEDQTSAVKEAINEFVTDTEEKIKKEYEKTLEESYKDWDVQLKEARKESQTKLTEAEKTAYDGYEEAKTMLEEKDRQIQTQKNEFEAFLAEQYEEAKKMIDEEKARNDKIEQDLYEAYTQQVQDIKEDLVNKIDDFLGDKIEEISEAVRKELRNSPEVLETKVAYNRIKDIVASSITTEDISESANEKVEALENAMAAIQSEVKALKAKNLRLATENQNYEKQALNESAQIDEVSNREKTRKETERRIAEKVAENVEGRGNVVNLTEEDLIKEKENAADEKGNQEKLDETTANDLGYANSAELKKVAGLK
jgi:hypothetical protein